MNSKNPTHQAYIGLGSNLSDPVKQIQDALKELGALPSSQLTAHSSLYRSDPVGQAEQPDYINAAAMLSTTLEAHQLLDELQKIEQLHQRVRKTRWGARTLDLDLLLYGNEQINSSRLQVPHPYLKERNFVLYPLAELKQNLTLPGGETLLELIRHCPMGTLERLAL